MVHYQVSFNSDGSICVQGNFKNDSLVRSIPSHDPDRKDYVDAFLHHADLEQARAYLQCISLDKPQVVNEALFIGGLNNTLKCFKRSKVRAKLDKKNVFVALSSLVSFEHFEEMRDKHFVHDENAMFSALAFLLIDPDATSLQKLSGAPSVVWNRKLVNFYTEGLQLQQLIDTALTYVENRIDSLSAQIAQRYESLSRDELLAFEEPTHHLATLNNIGIART